MEIFRRRLTFPLLCLVVGLTVFGVSYSMFGQGPGEDDTSGATGNTGEEGTGSGGTPTPGGDEEGEIGPVGVVNESIHTLFTGDAQQLEQVLAAGANPNTLDDRSGLAALHFAVSISGDSDTAYGKIKVLLDYGANPNLPDNDGETPMHAAAVFGSEATMLALLNAGRDPNIATGELTPSR